MATIKDITTMCKAGQIEEAYTLVKSDFEAMPTDLWVQRAMGWVLYYLLKQDTKAGDYTKLVDHLEEYKSLDQLTVQNDSMIFDNVLFKIAEFIKNHVFPTDIDANAKLSTIFAWLKGYEFNPSKGYSFLLQSHLKFEAWGELADFFEWWNFDKLRQEDYTPYIMQNGKKMMTLAERVFIANSKALLKIKDLGRIEEFLPKLDKLMNDHPEMMYPGYYYGKLLLSLGSDSDEALKVIVPFARKKSTEFWVWQLLSDVYTNDATKQLACLLRAVHCRTQESLLGKVRIKLADLYIRHNKLDLAKHQIDCVTRCYASAGRKLPYEIEFWINQSWINTVTSNSTDPIDYMSITNDILCNGTEEAIAVVSYFDSNSRKSTLIYGHEKRTIQKMRIKVGAGAVVKINYIQDSTGQMKVLNTTKIGLPNNLSYAMVVEGTIDKREDKDFAFLKSGSTRCFVSPNTVKKYGVSNGENVKGLIVYDYDKKKESWNWVCISIKK